MSFILIFTNYKNWKYVFSLYFKIQHRSPFLCRSMCNNLVISIYLVDIHAQCIFLFEHPSNPSQVIPWVIIVHAFHNLSRREVIKNSISNQHKYFFLFFCLIIAHDNLILWSDKTSNEHSLNKHSGVWHHDSHIIIDP